MTGKRDEDACRSCGHPRVGHYKAEDRTTCGLEAVYCEVDGCLCWDRFLIARPKHLSSMTAELKPPRPA